MPRPPNWFACSIVLLLLVAVSCASSTDDTAGAGASPTFEKISEEAFRYPEPVATISDLLVPAEEEAPWYVAGSVLDPGTGRTQGHVWHSDDGRTWEDVEVAPANRRVSEQIRAAVHFGGGVLAVGSAGHGDDADAVVWHGTGTGTGSADWTQTAPAEMGGRHEQWAFDIAAGDGGVVAVGGERAWGEVRPRLWHSVDGEEWQVVDGGSGGPFDQSGQESVSSVAAFGNGFVAVGWERVDGEQNGLAWYSPDGKSWEAVDAAPFGGEGRQAVLSVAAGSDAVVAGGYSVNSTGQGQPVVWRSSDGVEWGRASDPLPLGDTRLSTASDLVVQSLQVQGDSLLATGGARARPHIWRSGDDGRTWEALPKLSASRFPDGVDLVHAATDGATTVAVGSEPLVLKLDGDSWMNTTGDAFPNGGSKPVATSVVVDDNVTLIGGYHLQAPKDDQPQRYQAHVWRREGNGDFEVIGPLLPPEEGEGEGEGEGSPSIEEAMVQGFYAGAIEAMTKYASGYIAVGIEDFSVADERKLEDSSPNGMLWISQDGERWQRFAAGPSDVDIEVWSKAMGGLLDEYTAEQLAQVFTLARAEDPWVTTPPAGGPGTRSLRGVAPFGKGFIAVGSAFRSNDVEPIVARSSKGETIEAENADLGGGGTQRFNDICAVEGKSVAVGITGSDGRFDTAIRHRTGDGWQAATATDDSFSSPGNQQALACAVSDEGFIAVGFDDSSGSENAKVWLSEDGLEWEELRSGALGGSGDQQATAVTAVPDGGWLIAGTDTSGPDAGIALWRLRPNGEVYRRDLGEPALSGPVPMNVADVVVTDERTVIVGADVDGIGVWETKTSALDR